MLSKKSQPDIYALTNQRLFLQNYRQEFGLDDPDQGYSQPILPSSPLLHC